MAAPRTLAVVVFLLIAGSCIADAARTTTLMQNHRRLPWGEHHAGEVCSASSLGTLLTPLLRQIKVFLKADLSIACIDLVYLDVKGLLPLLITADVLPLRSTGHCSSLVDADVTLKILDLNLGRLVLC